MVLCEVCHQANAQVIRPETGQKVCKHCFSICFEDEVLQTIRRFDLISPGDSTVLMHVLHTLNQRYNLGFRIELVCIDEGIQGYRDNALETVKKNAESYGLPLTILSFTEMFGWSLDQIFRATKTKETCTYCGIFRRRALDIGAQKVGATKVAVGHNADDVAETVLLNVLRGDLNRYARSVDIKTDGIESKVKNACIPPRIKPFAFQNQKEIVYYAHFNNLLYYAVECTYAVQAFRRFPREYLVGKQQKDPLVMRRIIEGAIMYQQSIPQDEKEKVEIGFCKKCGSACNHDVCMACHLLEKLANGYAQKQIIEDKNE